VFQTGLGKGSAVIPVVGFSLLKLDGIGAILRLDDLMRVSVRQVLRQRWRNLGVVLAIALGSVLGSHPSEELFLFCVGLGLFFAVVLGIGAGLPPSIRASRMEVVSAVRYE